MVVNGPNPKALDDFKVVNIQVGEIEFYCLEFYCLQFYFVINNAQVVSYNNKIFYSMFAIKLFHICACAKVCYSYCVVLQGKLSGYGIEEQLPTIVVVAHYDTYGIAPVSSFY